MAVLTVQSINRAGITPSYTTPTTADQFLPGRYTFIHVKNTNAATRVVSVVTPGTTIGLAVADVSYTIAATTGDTMCGPFPAEHFADPTDGLADITFSATAGVTVAVLDLSQ